MFLTIAPLVVQYLVDARIPQGTSHTFVCRGIGSYIEWNIDGVSTDELTNHSLLKLELPSDSAYSDGCSQQLALTVHAKSAPEGNVMSTFAIQCVVHTKGDLNPAFSTANLTVHGKFICLVCIKVYIYIYIYTCLSPV